MHLRLVPPPDAAPHDGAPVDACRRPGERREPVSLALPPAFVAAALELGLTVPLAVELSLERTIARAELTACGREDLWSRIVAAARATRVESVASTYARYMRSLTVGRRQAHAASATTASSGPIDVPLRLFPRVLTIDQADALTSCSLQEALLLEVAALASGRLMTEWVALTALGLSSALPDEASGDGLGRQRLA